MKRGDRLWLRGGSFVLVLFFGPVRKDHAEYSKGTGYHAKNPRVNIAGEEQPDNEEYCKQDN
jgi:hypothetical protein